MRPNHARQQHEDLAAVAQLGRQLDDPRQHTRHLDDGDGVLAPERVLAAQSYDEVERLVGHLRERVRRVQPHRHEQRAHLLLEKIVDPAALLFVAVGVTQDHDALGMKLRADVVVEHLILLVDQRMGGSGDGVEVAHRHARSRAPSGFQVVGNANLEKFVHVAGHDAHVAQAFQQGHIGAARLSQHAAVELQERALPIQQNRHVLGGGVSLFFHGVSLRLLADEFVRSGHRGALCGRQYCL